MHDTFEIHPAAPDELVEAHRNVFELWNKGLSLSDHIGYRLTSPQQRRASWFVGCEGGRVVTSLGCHPFRFDVRGELVSGVGIASVYTVAEYRRRGYAARLLDWAHSNQRARGIGLAVLFSDIDPDYYARLGYLPCPCFAGWSPTHDVSVRELRHGRFRLEAFSGSNGLAEMARIYQASERHSALSIVRDESDWLVLAGKSADDEFFWLESPLGTRAGYVRLVLQNASWRVMDYAVTGDEEELLEALFEGLIAQARARGVTAVGGWLPDRPAVRRLFSLNVRPNAIAMLRPIAWSGVLDDELLNAAVRFREIDHV